MEYAITWHRNVVRLGKRGKKLLSLGLCAQSGDVAFISVTSPTSSTWELVKPLIVKDVTVDESYKDCGDAAWCLNLNCRFNKADIKHFKKYGIRNEDELKRMHLNLRKIKQELKLEVQDEDVMVEYGKPAVYITIKKKDEKRV